MRFRILICTLLILGMSAGIGWPVYRATHRRFTYVLVHGAYGGGWNWREVDALLTADGQKVFRPTLTGQGEKYHLNSESVTLNTHIQDVVNMIEFEDLHDVVLVGHSYGGMVVTGVADRIPDRIKCLIYLDATLPEDGETNETAAHNALKPKKPYKQDAIGRISADLVNLKSPLPHDEPEPGGAFYTPIHLVNQLLAAKIPTRYMVFVPKGKTVDQARFYPFYQRAQARGWKVFNMTSDHNAEWSHPRELADFLENAP
jgi:pimeloyl-ACP methyl ester carboxylesterase